MPIISSSECYTPSPAICCSVINGRISPAPIPPPPFALSPTSLRSDAFVHNTTIYDINSNCSDSDSDKDDTTINDINIPFRVWLEEKRKIASMLYATRRYSNSYWCIPRRSTPNRITIRRLNTSSCSYEPFGDGI
jgi:hypothetical protein